MAEAKQNNPALVASELTAGHLAPVMQALAGRLADPAALDSIEQLAAGLPPDRIRSRNLSDMRRSDVQFVVTGQQVGLAGGPLLTLVKAASAVAAAERIEQLTGRRTIPLFWLQTEDHDLREAVSLKVPAESGSSPLALFSAAELQQAEQSRIPVEYIDPAPWSGAVLKNLQSALGLQPAKEQALELVTQAYQKSAGFGGALAYLFSSLLPESGLLFFNYRRLTSYESVRPVYRTAFERADEIEKLIASSGADEQVRVVKDSPLFFIHDPDGNRRRIVKRSDGVWEMSGSSVLITTAEIEQIFASDLSRLSTTALLRPLIEDTLFPTVAYVGGAAELAYLRQIGPLYSFLSIPEPLRLSRWSVAIGEGKFRNWLEGSGLTVSDLAAAETAIAAKIAGRHTEGTRRLSPNAVRAGVLERIAPAVDYLREHVGTADQTLLQPVSRFENKIVENLAGIITKYSAALLRSDEVLSGRIARMKQMYFPGGVEQERSIALVYFLSRFGVGSAQAVLDAVRSAPAGQKAIELYL